MFYFCTNIIVNEVHSHLFDVTSILLTNKFNQEIELAPNLFIEEPCHRVLKECLSLCPLGSTHLQKNVVISYLRYDKSEGGNIIQLKKSLMIAMVTSLKSICDM